MFSLYFMTFIPFISVLYGHNFLKLDWNAPFYSVNNLSYHPYDKIVQLKNIDQAGGYKQMLILQVGWLFFDAVGETIMSLFLVKLNMLWNVTFACPIML